MTAPPPTSQIPSAPPVTISPTLTIQPPLSRRGTGPGLILIVPAHVDLSRNTATTDPPPLRKWAEESYAVAQILAGEDTDLTGKVGSALAELGKVEGFEGGVALLVFDKTNGIAEAINAHPAIVAAGFYGSAPPEGVKIPTREFPPKDGGAFFAIPSHKEYSASSASVLHSATLRFFKGVMNGPYFDLEAIWEEHTRYEFENRSLEETMATMVEEPYVNNIPTLTGGIGRKWLTEFYRDHFIFSNPEDSELVLVSRTIGVDRIIDEFVFKCTHDRPIGWMIPGIPPTGKKLSVPFTSIVDIRGDRLYHEHIAWDQGTVLRQLGLLPEWLPYPYALPDGRVPAQGKRFEYKVPVAGAETALKLADANAVPSNEMLAFEVREVDDN
ncbi:hypothetical protein OQA88_10574 [Cercophora sp. LCS_1]